MKFRTGIAALLSLACMLVAVGCGEDDGLGKKYKVTGKVTYKGAPLTKGTVNFYPEDAAKGQPAAGVIQPDGTYSLTTRESGDGALAGKYKVAIMANDVDESKVGVPSKGGSQDQVAVAKAQGKSTIPIKYTGTDKSGLSAEVSSGKTKFDFDLVD